MLGEPYSCKKVVFALSYTFFRAFKPLLGAE
nr:MAG TPA: hypothetical protein [Caudoviricetes sp.]